MANPMEVYIQCEDCTHFHSEMLPKNYRVWIPPEEEEEVLLSIILDFLLEEMFIVSTSTRHSVKVLIGNEILSPRSKQFLYPSQVVSIFLSNVMDLLQSVQIVEILAFKFVKPHFWDGKKLQRVLQRYDLWLSHALVGGLFSLHKLLKSHAYMTTYDTIKHALEKQNFSDVEDALHLYGNDLGPELKSKIKVNTEALLLLIEAPYATTPTGFSVYTAPFPDVPTSFTLTSGGNAISTGEASGSFVQLAQPQSAVLGWNDAHFNNRGPQDNAYEVGLSTIPELQQIPDWTTQPSGWSPHSQPEHTPQTYDAMEE